MRLKPYLGFLIVVLTLGLGATHHAQAQTITIEKTWGGMSEEWGRTVVVDSSGNVYVIGDTDSFGLGMHDIFLLKYDPHGILLWQKTWGGGDDDRGHHAAVDHFGNVYVTGYTGWADSILIKFDSTGALQWQKAWGGVALDFGNFVAVDSEGDVYVTGTGGGKVFLLKYDAAGNLLWQKTWGGGAGSAVLFDSSGNLYVVGGWGFKVLLLKVRPDGTLLWQKAWGGPGWDITYAGTIDSLGNVYVTGSSTSFSYPDDVFLVKFGPDGTPLWQKTWGGADLEQGRSVAVDPSGYVYVAGVTTSFGNDHEALLLKYDPAGSLIWHNTWGGEDWDEGESVSLDPSGNVYMTGNTANPSRILRRVFGTSQDVSGSSQDILETWQDASETSRDLSGTSQDVSGSEVFAGAMDAFLLVLKPTPTPSTLLDFNWQFATNNVRVIYPSDKTPKPLGRGAAMVSDWLASAFVITKLQYYTEGLDTNSNFVNQTSGNPMGNPGIGIVGFGGPMVAVPVYYYELNKVAPVIYCLVPGAAGPGQPWSQWYLANGTAITETAIGTTDSLDLFLMEVFSDADGRYAFIAYGIGYRGTYAAGKYFHTIVYPDLDSYNFRWIIVKWEDTNGDGFVNNPDDGDTYTVIASGS